MSHILNPKEYLEILIVNHFDSRNYDSDFEYLEEVFYKSTYWEQEICGLNHFLSRTCEKLDKNKFSSSTAIEWIYNLIETHKFKVAEGGVEFTDLLMRSEYIKGLTIDDMIIKIQQNIL